MQRQKKILCEVMSSIPGTSKKQPHAELTPFTFLVIILKASQFPAISQSVLSRELLLLFPLEHWERGGATGSPGRAECPCWGFLGCLGACGASQVPSCLAASVPALSLLSPRPKEHAHLPSCSSHAHSFPLPSSWKQQRF